MKKAEIIIGIATVVSFVTVAILNDIDFANAIGGFMTIVYAGFYGYKVFTKK